MYLLFVFVHMTRRCRFINYWSLHSFQIFKVLNILRARGWKVCDVIQAVVRFCERVLKSSSKDRRPSLLSALLDTPHTTL